MSAKPAIILFKSFNNHLKSLDFTRVNAEKSFKKNIISKRDIEQVYKGLFLDAVASFEMFLENLFIGLLANQYLPGTKKVLPKVQFKTVVTARKIVINNNYFNWLPYSNTSDRAKAFFRNGYPFTSFYNDPKFLTFDFEKKIKSIYCVRNVVAHKSEYAKSQFEKYVIGSIALPMSEKKVAPYLRGVYRTMPNHTRYEKLVIEMAGIAKILCEY